MPKTRIQFNKINYIIDNKRILSSHFLITVRFSWLPKEVQLAISWMLRRQAIQRPVSLSSLQILMQGEAGSLTVAKSVKSGFHLAQTNFALILKFRQFPGKQVNIFKLLL